MKIKLRCRRINVWIGVIFGLTLMFVRQIVLPCCEVSLDYIPLQINIRDLVQAIQTNQTIDVKPINIHEFRYLRNPICCEAKDNCPNLVFVIKSAVGNIDQRLAIRNTWGKEGVFKTIRTKTFFLLGDVGEKSEFVSFLQLEDKLYKDIIQENFRDTYDNNTIKTIMGFNWVTERCVTTRYVMFLDDDFLILPKNIEPLIHLSDANGGEGIYVGHAMPFVPPIREHTSKWYVSEKEYPHKYYPTYASAGAYIMSMDIVKKFQIAFKYTQLFKIDDVYLGIVAKRLRISIQNHKGFNTLGPKDFSDRETLAVHWFKSYDMYSLWKDYLKNGTLLL